MVCLLNPEMESSHAARSARVFDWRDAYSYLGLWKVTATSQISRKTAIRHVSTHLLRLRARRLHLRVLVRRYNVTVGGTKRTLTYDTNGNLTEERLIGRSTRSYQWDSLNVSS